MSTYKLLIAFFLVPFLSKTQTSCLSSAGKYSNIRIEEIGYSTLLEKVQSKDTIMDSVSFTILNFHNCYGLLDFNKHLKLDSSLIVSGHYIDADSISKRIIVVEDLETGEFENMVREYYYPIKDGIWKYYSNGNLIQEKYYRQGELTEIVKHRD